MRTVSLLSLVLFLGCESEPVPVRTAAVKRVPASLPVASPATEPVSNEGFFAEPAPPVMVAQEQPAPWQGSGCPCAIGCANGEGPASFSVTLGGTFAANGTYTATCTGDCSWAYVSPTSPAINAGCELRSISIKAAGGQITVQAKYGGSWQTTFQKPYGGIAPCSSLVNESIPRASKFPAQYPETSLCATGSETCTITAN